MLSSWPWLMASSSTIELNSWSDEPKKTVPFVNDVEGVRDFF